MYNSNIFDADIIRCKDCCNSSDTTGFINDITVYGKRFFDRSSRGRRHGIAIIPGRFKSGIKIQVIFTFDRFFEIFEGVDVLIQNLYDIILVLQTDIQRLQQVLINLLTNAAKFTKNGTITLQFEVEKEKNRVLFAVADTGCGIPKEKQKQVFERFEKLNEYAQGTGLGLSICKLTVDKWGGDIWIDPDYEDGARFVVSHPL